MSMWVISRKQLLLAYHYEIVDEVGLAANRIGLYLLFLATPDVLWAGVVGLELAISTDVKAV